jgi:hypothetical protein
MFEEAGRREEGDGGREVRRRRRNPKLTSPQLVPNTLFNTFPGNPQRIVEAEIYSPKNLERARGRCSLEDLERVRAWLKHRSRRKVWMEEGKSSPSSSLASFPPSSSLLLSPPLTPHRNHLIQSVTLALPFAPKTIPEETVNTLTTVTSLLFPPPPS